MQLNSENKLDNLCVHIDGFQGGWQLVCALRVVQGLTQGFMYPSVHNIIGKWIPLDEKARLGTIIYSGKLMYYISINSKQRYFFLFFLISLLDKFYIVHIGIDYFH
jgi:MFS family permease